MGRFCVMEVTAIEYLLFIFYDAGSESFHRICECVLYDKAWKWGGVYWHCGVRGPYKPPSVCCLHTYQWALLQCKRVCTVYILLNFIPFKIFQPCFNAVFPMTSIFTSIPCIILYKCRLPIHTHTHTHTHTNEILTNFLCKLVKMSFFLLIHQHICWQNIMCDCCDH